MKEREEAKKILSMDIIRDRSRKIQRVSQFRYISKILNNFRIDNGKSVQMPLGGHFKLSLKDYPFRDCDVEMMSKVAYENVVGSLMYLMVCTRPNIAYTVSVFSRYLANPDRGYHVNVTSFVDSEKAKDPDKGKVYGLTEAVKEAIWPRGLLEKLGVKLNTVAVNCNNQDTIHLSRNHVFPERTKHINVRHHFIKEVLEAKTIEVMKPNRKPKVEIVITLVFILALLYVLELLSVADSLDFYIESQNGFGLISFKFYNSWLLYEDFINVTTDCWSSPTDSHLNLSVVISKAKLKKFKLAIKLWRTTVIATETTVAMELREKIMEIDLIAVHSPLSAGDMFTRSDIVKSLTALEHKNLKDKRQKAKVKWTLEGDENSSFFHGYINNRRNRSRINGLAIDGSWITDPSTMKSHIFHTFDSKFKETNHNRPSFRSNLFKQLSPDDNLLFENPFTLQEIKEVVWDCGGDKGSRARRVLFQAYQKIFGFTCLIGCQYKIIAKVLANRLAMVIPSVIGEVQMAFLKGRQITNGPLLVNEIESWAKKHKKKLFLFKLDFEKAFDYSKLVLLENFIEKYSKCLRLLVKLQLLEEVTTTRGSYYC
ncbi:retrovirus-related pol polyprotein from transposon TNT 1-94 [Tanacetum coccineum]